MNTSFSNFSDDFFVNVDLHTSLTLPNERETVLHFCESVQKQFPDLSDFYRRDNGEHILEANRQSGSYRWMSLDAQRLSMGAFNPDRVADAYDMHAWILDRSRYYLGISHLDVESLDLVYGFNLDYMGNRDAIVFEALLSGSPLASLVVDGDAMPLNVEPSFIVALDEDCCMQARLNIETRNSSYQVRTGRYDEEPISVYFTIRAYPQPSERFDIGESFKRQKVVGEEMLTRVVIPQILRPIASAISAAQ